MVMWADVVCLWPTELPASRRIGGPTGSTGRAFFEESSRNPTVRRVAPFSATSAEMRTSEPRRTACVGTAGLTVSGTPASGPSRVERAVGAVVQHLTAHHGDDATGTVERGPRLLRRKREIPLLPNVGSWRPSGRYRTRKPGKSGDAEPPVTILPRGASARVEFTTGMSL
jgi:hypothetical protein